MIAYLGLGSNVGSDQDKLSALRRAVDVLSESAGIRLTAASSIYKSEPWGYSDQPDFLNAVVEIETTLDPRELLAAVKQAELAVGRTPTFRWGPRVIDIDILIYGHTVVDSPGLTLPHPHLLRRNFVVVPLLEIAPDVLLPDGSCVSEGREDGSGAGKLEKLAGEIWGG